MPFSKLEGIALQCGFDDLTQFSLVLTTHRALSHKGWSVVPWYANLGTFQKTETTSLVNKGAKPEPSYALWQAFWDQARPAKLLLGYHLMQTETRRQELPLLSLMPMSTWHCQPSEKPCQLQNTGNRKLLAIWPTRPAYGSFLIYILPTIILPILLMLQSALGNSVYLPEFYCCACLTGEK